MQAADVVPEIAPGGLRLQMSAELQPPPRGAVEHALPAIVRARELRGRPDLDTEAEGDAEFRRGGVVIRAERLTYDNAEDLAQARGNVRVSREGNVYTGPQIQLRLQRFEGFFLNPSYHFGSTGAGGTAQRIDFIDEQRSVAIGATYSSCPSDGSGGPDWLLSTDRVKFDFAANEGIAEGAVLRFFGVPILAAPVLSFPLTDARKSGWLPPSIELDSKSGLQLAVPYYWNIAPNRDATVTPLVSARRGVGAALEFRYLEPRYSGSIGVDALPHDALAGRSRYALNLQHDNTLPGEAFLSLRALRVSDDEYWKDFPHSVPSLTPRLLAADLKLSRPFGPWNVYARALRWQVLQNADASNPIYAQLITIYHDPLQPLGDGFELSFESELNRFVDPIDGTTTTRPTGVRAHAVASLARTFAEPGWWVTPKLLLNAASYALDRPLADGAYAGRRSATRTVPSVSVDAGWILERDARWFGRAMRQTLEPRLLYVNTPYRNQAGLPTFDFATKDFNFESIFTENDFSGIDRIADANQITAGLTTRVLDPQSGAEALRLGIVQRFRFRDQRVTATSDGAADGPVSTQRFSDVLLLGSTTVVPSWTLDGSVQYDPDSKRSVRSVVGARYAPGPYRTLAATYRFARGLSEQIELAWQWPIGGAAQASGPGVAARGDRCSGNWYAVGRINYSTRDSRVTDSVLGLEYDGGCWIGRVVAQRLSTGRSEATTRLSFQLELVGLSRLNLGSNPLQALKDNIPGFKLLREERAPNDPLNPYE